MAELLGTLLDHAVNRASGVYAGLDPRTPRSLVIPRFVTIAPELPSLTGEIARHVPLHRLKRPLVLADAVTWEIAGQELFDELEAAGRRPQRHLVESNAYAETRQVLEAMTRRPRLWSSAEHPWERRVFGPKIPGVVLGVGGGTVIDQAKLVAYQLHVPCITVPTSLANDGIASPFSVIRPDGPGAVTVPGNTPLGVLLDLGRILPRSGAGQAFFARMMRSGLGDALSNLTSVMDWRLAAAEGRESLDYLAMLHARSAGEAVLQRLLGGASLDDPDLVLTLAAGLVSSGEAMARVGSSRPASGFDHKLYHAYHNILRLPSRATHGVLVAVGALVSAHAHAQGYPALRDGMALAGLPTTAADLEAWELSLPGLEQAIHRAVEVKPTRYTILEHLGPDALVASLREVYR